MSQEIGKSPEMLQKEAKIRELQAILRKRKSVLKGLKTRLTNNKKEIEEVQFKSSTHIMGIYERLDELRREVADLAKQLTKLDSISDEDRYELNRMSEEFADDDILGAGFNDYQQKKAANQDGNYDFEEQARAKIYDLFQEFQVKPDEKEQKDIRKVFVKLSNKFHPDRARNDKEATQFHEMQQKLNDAYQSGDIHTLLEMERLYLMEEIDLSEAKSYTVDVLQQALEKLEKELQFIENQILRFREEIKNLRSSDLGAMLTDLKRAKKYGAGLEDQIEEMEASLEKFTELRDVMKECLEKKDLGPMMKAASAFGDDLPFSPDDMSPEEALGFLDQLFNGEEGDLFEKMEEMTRKAEVSAKFDYDQTVKIKSHLRHLVDPKIKLKNAVGRVTDFNLHPNGQLVYEISLDSHTLQKFPKKFIQNCVDNDMKFQDVPILEEDLVACTPRDTEAESVAAYRTLYHTYNWDYLEEEEEKMLQEILLAIPQKNDEENWEKYLRNKIKYPFEAITGGVMDHPPGIKMIVKGIDYLDEEDGFIMKVKINKRKEEYPLFDMEILDEQSELYQVLQVYSEWQEEYYDDLDNNFFF